MKLETFGYLLMAVWFGTILVFGACMMVFVIRWMRSGQAMPPINSKDRLILALRAFPKTIKVLWWTLLILTILLSIWNTYQKRGSTDLNPVTTRSGDRGRPTAP